MSFTFFINIGIVLLSAIGFASTTYGGKLEEFPDRFENPAVAFGFGLTGLIATLTLLGYTSYLCTLLLVHSLIYLNLW